METRLSQHMMKCALALLAMQRLCRQACVPGVPTPVPVLAQSPTSLYILKQVCLSKAFEHLQRFAWVRSMSQVYTVAWP